MTSNGVLDLSGRGLSAFELGPDELVGVTTVDLSGNFFREVPSRLRDVPGLERLVVRANPIETFPDFLCDMPSLRDVEIEARGPLVVPDRIFRHPGLRRIVVRASPTSARGLVTDRAVLAGGTAPSISPAPTRTRVSGLEEVVLEGLGLQAVPVPIYELPHLKYLSLDDNLVTELRPELGRLSELRGLSLYNNELAELPCELGELSSLETLDLSDNPLGSVPDAVWRCTGLETLRLGGCGLAHLTSSVGSLTRLRYLSLSSNQLETLPAEVSALRNLNSLYLDGNELASLPTGLFNLGQLRTLVLGSNRIRNLPDDGPEWREIEYLDLGTNGLERLPLWMWGLASLRTLNIASNAIDRIPDAVCDLRNLEDLDARDNAIAELPPAIGLLSRLRYLRLDDNQLTDLPAESGRLSSLTHLWLDRNPLQGFPAAIASLVSLEDLDLRNAGLRTLPSEVGSLRALKSLDLSFNHLAELPDEIARLPLQLLDLSANELQELPPCIPKMVSLTELRLRGNLLRRLPPSIASLRSLVRLDLGENQLAELPEEIGDLDQLMVLPLTGNALRSLPLTLGRRPELYIEVDNNPLLSPPPEIAAAGGRAVLAYLNERLEDSEAQWSAKLLLVGEGGVGKSSLLRSLKRMPFVEGLSTTHGIDVSDMPLQHPAHAGVVMEMRAWDFGGQEIYHATHQFFLTNRSVFVVVWNARFGFEQGRLFYWLDTIQALAPNSPVLVVSTQVDERAPDISEREIREKYPQVREFLDVSNKTGDGVDAVREAIRREAARLPLMGEPWPTAWIRAAEAVRSLPQQYIAPTEFGDHLEANGVLDINQRVLARWLHELGDILYFEGDGLLGDIVILKPQWVSGYISRVLDSEHVADSDGVFDRDEMNRIWDDLTPALRTHFLHLMERFDLSYRTLEDREVSLVVERLPRDPPDGVIDQWRKRVGDERIREVAVRYRLTTVPAGIPTWFIARSHRFTTHQHWRNGAVFRYQTAMEGLDGQQSALVESSQHSRHVELRVRGPNPHNFFALLMDGFELTLARFPGLGVDRLIPCPGHNGADCGMEFDYQNVVRYWERGRQTIECQQSLESVSVPQLLFGWGHGSEEVVLRRIQDIVEGTKNEVRQLRDGQSELLAELVELRQLSQREFLNLYLREQRVPDTCCPNVFVLRPLERGGLRAIGEALGVQRLELHLYCQQPGCWHPTVAGGTYEMTVEPEWLRELAPLLNRLVTVLKFAAPVVGPWIGAVDPDAFTKGMQSDIALMKELVAKLPDVKLAEDVGPAGAGVQRVGGAELRSLRVLLDRHDPQQMWGGLQRVVTPEGHIMWLCETHATEYHT